MYKKTLFGVIMVLGVLVIGGAAFAHGPRYGYGNGDGHMMGYGGQGYMMGYGNQGYMMGYGNNGVYNEKTAKIENELDRKQRELASVLSAPQVNGPKQNP